MAVRKLVSRRRFLEGSTLAVTGSAMAAAFSFPGRSPEQERGEDFVELLGGFPPRRPLEVQVTDQHQEDGYVRKRIVYTTEPGVQVPAFCSHPHARRVGPLFFPASLPFTRMAIAILMTSV